MRDSGQGCNTLSVGFRKMSNPEKTSSLGEKASGQKPFFKEAGALSHPGARPDYRDMNLEGLDRMKEAEKQQRR